MGSSADYVLPPSKRIRYGYAIAVVVLVLSLALVVASWRGMRERELAAAGEQFRAQAGQQASLVQQHLNNIELTLRGGASLFTAMERPSPEHWKGYVDGLDLPSRFPSLLGLGFAAHVDGIGLQRLQEDWRDGGRGLLQIWPPGIRDQYAIILYMQPESAANRTAVGFDMMSEVTRRSALIAAVDAGAPKLSGSINLMRDRGAPAISTVLYVPVYANVASVDSLRDRRAAIRGWVYAPFRIDSMLESAFASVRSPLLTRVVDTTGSEQVVLGQDAGIDANHAFTHSLTMEFYGRRWRFDFFSGPRYAAAPQLADLNRPLYLGIAVSLLLFAFTWVLASTEARARRLAVAMNESSRRSEQRFRNAMRYSAIGKALLDSNGAIAEWNPAFEAIVQRSPETLLGMPFNSLLGDESEALSTEQMQAFDELEGGVVRLTRSVQRGGGETRFVQLTFAPVPSEPGIDIARLVQVEDVTERMRAEEAVQALNRTLEARVAARTRELSAANRELESFAYSVSHDLRAPLRGIEGFSRLLEERHATGLDETGREYLLRVRNGTARMGELIDALLRLARIGRTEPEFVEVDLSALAEQVVADLADAEPGRMVDVRIQPGMTVWADQALSRNLLDNLLGNAWKFTRSVPAARIEMSMQRDASGVVWFEVRDNGAGFDPDYANKLFKPFQRLHSQEECPGYGIGLASVKRIIERHGGDIEAEGQPGKGATFRFTLVTSAGVGTEETT